MGKKKNWLSEKNDLELLIVKKDFMKKMTLAFDCNLQ